MDYTSFLDVVTIIMKQVLYTGLLVLQNAQPHFCTPTLDRRNYWAELAEILYVTPQGGNSRLYRGFFGNSVWGPRYGVSREPQGWAQKFGKIFSRFFHFIRWEWLYEGLNCSYT